MFTVRQVAELLGVSASTVYALVAARKLRHERIGLGRGAIRIPRDAVDEYRKSRTVGVAEDGPEPPAPAIRARLRHLRPSSPPAAGGPGAA